jgi:hypothetical protein
MASPAPQRIARVRWEAHDPRQSTPTCLPPFANLAGWRLGMLTSPRGASGVVCSASGLRWRSTVNPMRLQTPPGSQTLRQCSPWTGPPASATAAVRGRPPFAKRRGPDLPTRDAMTSGLGLRDLGSTSLLKRKDAAGRRPRRSSNSLTRFTRPNCPKWAVYRPRKVKKPQRARISRLSARMGFRYSRRSARGGAVMDWACMLAYVTGTLAVIPAGESPANRGVQTLLSLYPAAGRVTDTPRSPDVSAAPTPPSREARQARRRTEQVRRDRRLAGRKTDWR